MTVIPTLAPTGTGSPMVVTAVREDAMAPPALSSSAVAARQSAPSTPLGPPRQGGSCVDGARRPCWGDWMESAGN
eukprot:12920509-Prorocentrum_lima.AAC.1